MSAALALTGKASADQAQVKLREWRDNPVTFVREVLRAEPDDWQADMLMAFPHHNRLVGSACKGPGKTTGLSWLGWNFLATRPEAKVPCTSITGANLQDGLWAEFSLWQARSPFLLKAFQWTKTRIFAKERPETWWASARSWAKDADPQQQANTLAGLHADYICFLLDEVSDIPDGVVAAAEGALTSGKECKLAMMGNPTRTEGPLYRAVTADRRLFHVTTITGDPDDPRRSPRINIEEARKQIEKYGRDSYVVRVNILGLFPHRQADKLLDVADVDAARERTLPPTAFEGDPRIIGVDVARFGDDKTIFCPRQGRMTFPSKEFSGLDNVEVAEELIRAIEKWDADAAFVDGGGNGGGVIDVCRSRGYGHRVHEKNFGQRAAESDRFENLRTEMYWNAAEWVRGGGCLPRGDHMLATELASPRYWFDKRNRVCLEPSQDVKARLGYSPDRASAFVLTFAGPVRSKRQQASSLLGQGARTRHDFDPYAG